MQMSQEELKDPLVSIIIPYFQRTEGLIRRCVESIVNQISYANYHVLIIDDESPIAPEPQLKDILESNPKINIIKQNNQGPGAARNKGLENLPPLTKYVAFIDSDDWWEPNYLSTAVTALENGNDLFFANSSRFGQTEPRFDWQRSKNLNLTPEAHTLLDPEKSVYTFKGEFFSYALVRSNIISTSAMCYRLSQARNLKFNVDLYNGQDRLFKLALCQKTNAIAFSPKILVQEGEGINIFDSAKWGSPQSLRLNSSYIKLCKTILRELTLKRDHVEVIKKQLNECRYSLTSTTLHLLKSGNGIDWKLLKKTSIEDPGFLIRFLPNTLKIMTSR